MASQIRMPDGSTISEQQFRQMVQNNQISSGPGGAAEQNAVDTGVYDPNYGQPKQGQGGQATTAAPGTSGSSSTSGPYNVGTDFGASANTGNADTRTEDVYAMRSSDDPISWAKRAFAQGTADFGQKSLNPYLDQNPLANSPFAKWYQDRYGVAAPTNALVAAQLTGKDPSSDYFKGQMQSMQGNGQMGPGTSAGAQQNLSGLRSMLQNQAAGGDGLNPTQTIFAGQLLNDPQLASQIVSSQMQGATGGWGMGYLNNALSNLATHYYNDPSNMGPQGPNGSFLQQAMKMMGMR